MPSSRPWRISPVAEMIYRFKPASVLDIGVGFGKWGMLAREYTDGNKGRCNESKWQVRIEGIEIFPAYENVVWKVYNKVHIGNAAKILPKLGNYDLILAIEVLEHMSRIDGYLMMQTIKQKCKNFIISYSNGVSVAVNGNKYEEHISQWSPQDFLNCKLLCQSGPSEVYVGKGDLK